MKAALEGRIASRAQRLELLEKLDMAMTFLQQAGAERELELLRYFAIFKINTAKLRIEGLAVKHVVHLYEIF